MTGPEAPVPEVAIDGALVRSLLRAQHPDLADLPLTVLDAGWDNVIYRLGSDLLVRLPRRAVAAPLVRHEQRWLPQLANRLPLPVPSPVRLGVPSDDYPWPWSVTPWFPGASAMTTPPADPVRAARVLGRFVRALHRPAPADAPPNPYRGVPLADRDEATRARIDELADRMPSAVDPGRLRAAWDAHVALPPWDGPPLWLHGDLHAHNVVVRDGETTAVIDFGDITAGDPATDLFVAWMLLPPDARPVFQAAAAADDLTWARARGWALTLALAYVGGSQSTPDFVALGHRTLEAVLADDWAI